MSSSVPPSDAASSDALAELESALRDAKMALAHTHAEKDTLHLAVAAHRRALLSAMEQLSLVQQAMDSKILRKGVSRSMALSGKDKQRRAAVDALGRRNRALVAALTHTIAGVPTPGDLSAGELTPDQKSVIAATYSAAVARPRPTPFAGLLSSFGVAGSSPLGGAMGGGYATAGTGAPGGHAHLATMDEDISEDELGDDDDAEYASAHAGGRSSVRSAAGRPGKHAGTAAESDAHIRRQLKRVVRTVRQRGERAGAVLLHDASIAARVYTFLGPADTRAFACVCRAFRGVPLRADFEPWKQLARTGSLTPEARSALWPAVFATAAFVPPSHAVAWDNLLMARLIAWLDLPAMESDAGEDDAASGLRVPHHRGKRWDSVSHAPDTAGVLGRVHERHLRAMSLPAARAASDVQRVRHTAHDPPPRSRLASVAKVYNLDSDEEEDETPAGLGDASERQSETVPEEESDTNTEQPSGKNETDVDAAAPESWLPRRRLHARSLLKLYCLISPLHASKEHHSVASIMQAATSFARESPASRAALRTLRERLGADVLAPTLTALGLDDQDLVNSLAVHSSMPGHDHEDATKHVPKVVHVTRGSTIINHSMRFACMPVPTALSLIPNAAERDTLQSPEADVRAASNPQSTRAGSLWGTRATIHRPSVVPEANGASMPNVLPAVPGHTSRGTHDAFGRSCPAFDAYMRAAHFAQRAHAAVAGLKELASALKTARASYNSALETIRRAAESDTPLRSDITVTFATADEEVRTLEAKLAKDLHDVNDLIQRCREASDAADDAAVKEVLDARRVHAEQLAAAWLRGVGDGARASATAPVASMMVDPATGAVIPTHGMVLPGCPRDAAAVEHASSTIASLQRVFRRCSPLSSDPVTRDRIDADLRARRVTHNNPMRPLPPRVMANLIQACLADADPAEEEALGIDGVDPFILIVGSPLATPLAQQRSTSEAKPVTLDFGPPADGVSITAADLQSGLGSNVVAEANHDGVLVRVVLSPLPFASQHILIDADVKRTFGEFDAALKRRQADEHVPATGSDASASQCLSSLLPTSFLSAEEASSPPSRDTVALLRQRLRHCLLAYAVYDRDVGYCQGMNFLAAVMLLHLSSPADAFAGLNALIHGPRFGFYEIFGAGLRRVSLTFNQITALLQRYLPALATHLKREHVAPDMYAAGWVMTVFSSFETLPLEYVVRVWDAFFIDGWKSVLRVVLVLLESVSSDLSMSDFATIVQFLHTYPSQRLPPAASGLLRRAARFRVTNRLMGELERAFELALAPHPEPASLPVSGMEAAASPDASGRAHARQDSVIVHPDSSEETDSHAEVSSAMPGISSLSPAPQQPTMASAGSTASSAASRAASPAPPQRPTVLRSPSLRAKELTAEHVAAMLSGQLVLEHAATTPTAALPVAAAVHVDAAAGVTASPEVAADAVPAPPADMQRTQVTAPAMPPTVFPRTRAITQDVYGEEDVDALAGSSGYRAAPRAPPFSARLASTYCLEADEDSGADDDDDGHGSSRSNIAPSQARPQPAIHRGDGTSPVARDTGSASQTAQRVTPQGGSQHAAASTPPMLPIPGDRFVTPRVPLLSVLSASDIPMALVSHASSGIHTQLSPGSIPALGGEPSDATDAFGNPILHQGSLGSVARLSSASMDVAEPGFEDLLVRPTSSFLPTAQAAMYDASERAHREPHGSPGLASVGDESALGVDEDLAALTELEISDVAAVRGAQALRFGANRSPAALRAGTPTQVPERGAAHAAGELAPSNGASPSPTFAGGAPPHGIPSSRIPGAGYHKTVFAHDPLMSPEPPDAPPIVVQGSIATKPSTGKKGAAGHAAAATGPK